jgi:transposase
MADSHGAAAEEARRPGNRHALHECLRQEHGYAGSYKSVLRFVRAPYPRPRRRPFRRVETPPGAQAPVDGGAFADLDVGAGPQKLYAFVMVLSHSRKEVLMGSERMDPLSWHHAHGEARRRLGGVPALLRIDNLKTGIAKGAGPWGEINEAYQAYAGAVGLPVDACLPRCPQHKGEVEEPLRGCPVRFVRRRLRLRGRVDNRAGLQQQTDEQLADAASRRLCPATAESVQQSFEAERRLLRSLPILPEPLDRVATRAVQCDCTVNFEGRSYSVPFVLAGLPVGASAPEVRGCAALVPVWHEGRVVAQHPRHTARRRLLEPGHYNGVGDERVAPPLPLGRRGQRLQEILEQPPEKRPLDLYAAWAELSR